MTKYEKKIYEIVNTSHNHMTAEQIFERLKEVYPGVVLATVYNNLNRLLEAGLIRKLSIEGMADRYDRTERHDHLICQKCGKLMDIRLSDLTAPLKEQLGEDFLFYDLKIYHICAACREKD